MLLIDGQIKTLGYSCTTSKNNSKHIIIIHCFPFSVHPSHGSATPHLQLNVDKNLKIKIE